MVDIRPNQLPQAIVPLTETDGIIVDQGVNGVRKSSPLEAVNSVAPVATQAEAVAGSDNTKRMTPLRTKQSIASEVGVTLASNAQGAKADSAVQSVNGKSGNSVTLVKGDVGLGNVDNTSDADKPISTATQNALDTKANSSVTISAGAGLDGGGNLTANRTVSLSAASIASLAKADSAVQTVNGVSPVAGNVTVSAEEKRLQDTRTAAIAESFGSNVLFVETAGYSAVGDGGGALYKRVSSEPSHAGKFQSADGSWWEIDPQSANPLSFGARGRGLQSDSAEDTVGVSSFLDYVFLPTSVVLVADLKGRCYVMQSGWSLPAGSVVKNKRVTNGKFQVSLASSGNFYILDFSTNGWTTEFRVDNISIRGDDPSDGTDVKLLGGIKFGDCAVVFADSLSIVGFTESGVKQTSPNFGQALYVSNSQVFGDFAGAFASRTTSNIAIDIAGGDIAIRGCQIGNANQLVRFRNNSNKLTDCHVFQYTNISNAGVVCDKAHGMQITNNYIDTCNLVLGGEANLSFNYWDNIINDNRFYCPPMFVPGAFFSFIWVNPKKANTSVNNMQICNNSFTMEPVGNVASIAVSTAEGTIDPSQISGFSMRGNTFYGVGVKTSHPSLEIIISSSNTGSVNAASLIPFGNIGYIKSSAWEAGAAVGYSISKSGTTVTATMATSVSGVMHVEATINTSNNP